MSEESINLISVAVSWPVAALLIVLLLRKPIMKVIDRFVGGQSGKARIGPIEFELGQLADDGKKAVHQLNEINYLVARSRLLELEITASTFGKAFSADQQRELEGITAELRDKLKRGEL